MICHPMATRFNEREIWPLMQDPAASEVLTHTHTKDQEQRGRGTCPVG